jgi:hypothetical protein
MCKNLDEYERLRQYEKDFKKEHSILVQKLEEATRDKTLKADITIERLLKGARNVPIEKGILDRARFRHEIRNPPGKKTDRLGDAVNWETLLDKVPYGETLYFIGDDGDYYSPIDRQNFNEFLLKEWNSRKGLDLVPYRSLSEFFKEHFPNINLAAELEKELLVRDFTASSSFGQTHTLIRRLEIYTEFTSVQVNDLAQAAIYNSQISFILKDSDVKAFLKPLIKEHSDDIGERELKLLRRQLNIEDDLEDDTEEEEDEEYEEMYLPWPN